MEKLRYRVLSAGISCLLGLLITAQASGFKPAALAADIAAENAATYAFDNENALGDWQLYGSYEEAGMTLTIDTIKREEGHGSLAVIQTINNPVTQNKFGGAFITSDAFDLENFAGCSMQVSYLFGDFPNSIDNFSIFSDGIVWVQTNIAPGTDNSKWNTATVRVPHNANNKRLGFTIPSFNPRHGVSVYIDNIIIFDKDGNAIANMGDYQPRTEETRTKFVSTWVNVLIYILIVLIIAFVIGAGVYVAKKHIFKRYWY